MKLKKYIAFYLITGLFFTVSYKLYFNIYNIILNPDYDARLIKSHGYCDREGYGFVKKMYDKYNFSKNIKIINFESNLYPDVSGFFYKKNLTYSDDKLILLNLSDKKYLLDFKDYKITENYKSCYLLEKND